jgi:hypothetical protein
MEFLRSGRYLAGAPAALSAFEEKDSSVMSEANASCKTHSAPSSDRAHTDDHAESLTDLIDVLQRQSFTRRFEPQTNGRVATRDASAASPAPRTQRRDGSSE